MHRWTGQKLVDRHREDVLVEKCRRGDARHAAWRQTVKADGEAAMSVPAVPFHIIDLNVVQKGRPGGLCRKSLHTAGKFEIEPCAVLGGCKPFRSRQDITNLNERICLD